MPKKISYLLCSLLGIAILISLVSINYTYPLTLGKISILYSDYGKFYHSQRLFIEGKNIYSPVYFIRNKNSSKPGHSLLSKPTANSKPTYSSHLNFRQVPRNCEPSGNTAESSSAKSIVSLAGNLNPPFFTLISFPLAYLSYSHALLLWTFISMLAGCLSILLIQQKLDPTTLSLPTCLLLLIGFMSFFPTFVTLQFGQVSLLLLPLLVLGWRAVHDHRPIKAAIFLGLATSLKPFIGLFLIYFLIRREWHALIAFLLTILISILITTAFFGIDTYYAYYQVCHQIAWAASSWNASIYGFLLRLIGGTEANTPLIPIPGLFIFAYPFLSGLLLLVLILFLRPLSCIADLQKKTDIDFSIILIGMLLLSPLGWMYYFTFLSIPFLILWNFSKKGIYPIGLPLLLAILLLVCNIPITLIPTNEIKASNVLPVFLSASLYFSVLLGLMGLLFAVRGHLSKKSTHHFERIPSNLLLLVCAVAFLPSILGITKTSSNWIRYAVNYSTEYTLCN